uniref:Uncharacterized protein n=1 Tax=Rhizophora mucronata TaxID=61149 RepID=A0A2P2QN96_RHIMU
MLFAKLNFMAETGIKPPQCFVFIFS